MKVYTYSKCSTCVKAKKYLIKNEIDFTEVPIRDNPPSISELKKMLKSYNGEIKKLFNTSGKDYRELNIKDKLPKLSQNDALQLLSKNGNLIKRPFLISKSGNTVGFKEENWEKIIK